jgi:hypothetical protein
MYEDVQDKSGLDEEQFHDLLYSSSHIIVNELWDYISSDKLERLEKPLFWSSIWNSFTDESKDALGLTLCMEVETQKNPSHVYFSKLRKENQEELKRRFVEFAETYRKTSEQKQKEEAEKRQKEEKNDILKKEIEDLEGLLRSKKRELGK